MPRCGNCQQNHATVQDVKACYTKGKVQVKVPRGGNILAVGGGAQKPATTYRYEAPEFPDSTKYLNGGRLVREKVEFPKVPAAHYALEDLPGHVNAVTFFEVKNGKGKWDGFQFVQRIVGGGHEYPVKGAAKAIVLRKIADDPQTAAKRYADEYGCCAVCGRDLTNDESRARGIGPDCWAKFGG